MKREKWVPTVEICPHCKKNKVYGGFKICADCFITFRRNRKLDEEPIT
jgi:hypothetical protein